MRAVFGKQSLGGFEPGGVSTGHIEGSAHYEGRAIDVFFRPITAESTGGAAGRRRCGRWRTPSGWTSRPSSSTAGSGPRAARVQGWRDYQHPGGATDNPVLLHEDHVHVDVHRGELTATLSGSRSGHRRLARWPVRWARLSGVRTLRFTAAAATAAALVGCTTSAADQGSEAPATSSPVGVGRVAGHRQRLLGADVRRQHLAQRDRGARPDDRRRRDAAAPSASPHGWRPAVALAGDVDPAVAREAADGLAGLPGKPRLVCSYPRAAVEPQEPGPSGLVPRARKLRAAWTEVFGPLIAGGFASAGVTTGHVDGSAHYEGRAIDVFFRPLGDAEQRRRGWVFAQWLVAHAPDHHVLSVIYDDHIWTSWASYAGWRDYVHPGATPRTAATPCCGTRTTCTSPSRAAGRTAAADRASSAAARADLAQPAQVGGTPHRRGQVRAAVHDLAPVRRVVQTDDVAQLVHQHQAQRGPWHRSPGQPFAVYCVFMSTYPVSNRVPDWEVPPTPPTPG